jgi:hydrogenase maturation protein HypF
VVQGVGFRPFVYNLALSLGLSGWVLNDAGGVVMEAEGASPALDQFLLKLKDSAPPVARVEAIEASRQPPAGYQNFEIRPSAEASDGYQPVSPDIALCPDCKAEILDSADRRHRYPFTNCTRCGPRFTIIEDMPYDRPRTTMKSFTMCSACQQEYDDPADRRFHAQPNACPVCGPRLELVDHEGKAVENSDPLALAAYLLRDGKIVALKGLGGFLLACDATNNRAVAELRQRKHRPSKPFAVMMYSPEHVEAHCFLSKTERQTLLSPQAPIVLLPWVVTSDLAPAVAPGLKQLGVMLPYTPLHQLLMASVKRPLVMTSGNLSEEPICRENREALERLKGIADYFLLHNRPIHAVYDDSVVMVERDSVQLLRRARGYAPYPIPLGFQSLPVLACGAEDKVAFCLSRGPHAFVSQHLGDMENEETHVHFERTVALYERLFRTRPEIVAHDLHPDYLTTRYARDRAAREGLKLVGVQHHHAHVVSCLADNGVDGPAIGVAFDGTGYGVDGRLWGGEFLVVDRTGYRRAAHLEYLPLPGGAAAIRRPWRTAAGYVLATLGPEALKKVPWLGETAGPLEMGLLAQQVEKSVNTPLTSSMGRLFDAVAALLSVRGGIDYDGQAAVELEALAQEASTWDINYPWHVQQQAGMRVLCLGEMLEAIIGDIALEVRPAVIARRFHQTVAELVQRTCEHIRDETGLRLVALAGGVFQNRLLLNMASSRLEEAGFTVLNHRQVPTNDGGIALGQAVIAGRPDGG